MGLISNKSLADTPLSSIGENLNLDTMLRMQTATIEVPRPINATASNSDEWIWAVLILVGLPLIGILVYFLVKVFLFLLCVAIIICFFAALSSA